MNTHISMPTNRTALPRRLVPRRTGADVKESFYGSVWDLPNPPIFQVGDMVHFEKANGSQWIVTILDIDGDDIMLMFYDGQPYILNAKTDRLRNLRILAMDTMSADDVEMYRRLLWLDYRLV